MTKFRIAPSNSMGWIIQRKDFLFWYSVNHKWGTRDRYPNSFNYKNDAIIAAKNLKEYYIKEQEEIQKYKIFLKNNKPEII
jgi:hypothetical protein